MFGKKKQVSMNWQDRTYRDLTWDIDQSITTITQSVLGLLVMQEALECVYVPEWSDWEEEKKAIDEKKMVLHSQIAAYDNTRSQIKKFWETHKVENFEYYAGTKKEIPLDSHILIRKIILIYRGNRA